MKMQTEVVANVPVIPGEGKVSDPTHTKAKKSLGLWLKGTHLHLPRHNNTLREFLARRQGRCRRSFYGHSIPQQRCRWLESLLAHSQDPLSG